MESIDRPIRIRDASPEDAAVLADFNGRMAEETEGRALDPAIITAGVAALLEDNNKGRYWVAEYNSRVVGQIMVTYEWSDWRNGNLWWIQSVYVHPDMFRLEEEVVITVNGEEVFRETVEPDLGFMLEQFLENRDRKLLYVAKISVEL